MVALCPCSPWSAMSLCYPERPFRPASTAVIVWRGVPIPPVGWLRYKKVISSPISPFALSVAVAVPPSITREDAVSINR